MSLTLETIAELRGLYTSITDQKTIIGFTDVLSHFNGIMSNNFMDVLDAAEAHVRSVPTAAGMGEDELKADAAKLAGGDVGLYKEIINLAKRYRGV